MVPPVSFSWPDGFPFNHVDGVGNNRMVDLEEGRHTAAVFHFIFDFLTLSHATRIFVY